MTLELISIRKKLGEFTLKDVSLSVSSGEYFVILGPSGVGKTVLLETIAGLTKPDSGRITWKGRDITCTAPEMRRFALVYQDYALFPHLNMRQNIAYGLKARGWAKHEIDSRVKEVAKLAGIPVLLERFPATLSGGEAQRAALARALAVSPELLLLDEPLSAVDLSMRRTLRQVLKRIHTETGTTVLHVTHDVDEAMELGDRIGVMLDGRLRSIGTPEEIFLMPADLETAVFIGMRNVLKVDPSGEGFCDAYGTKIHVGERNGRFSHIWIRPEEILLSKGAFESSARNQLECEVVDYQLSGVLVSVRVTVGRLTLTAMITYSSFQELGVENGMRIYATFKSSSVHCF